MADEIKLVTRQETFNDLAVRELAKSRAACICRVQFGRCNRSQCTACSVYARYKNCYDQLSDYDKTRLMSYVSEQYSIMSESPDYWRTHKSFVLHYIGLVCIILLFMVSILFLISLTVGPMDKPKNITSTYHTKIVCVMILNQTKPRDLNKDDQVNCIDYTLNFKLNWDMLYPDLKDKCQIVRNRNYITGMNHLFIMIDDQIFVEPWAWNPYDYRMESNWDSYYNPKFNIYGETEHWLKEVRIE